MQYGPRVHLQDAEQGPPALVFDGGACALLFAWLFQNYDEERRTYAGCTEMLSIAGRRGSTK